MCTVKEIIGLISAIFPGGDVSKEPGTQNVYLYRYRSR